MINPGDRQTPKQLDAHLFRPFRQQVLQRRSPNAPSFSGGKLGRNAALFVAEFDTAEESSLGRLNGHAQSPESLDRIGQ
jgi:hypothetical protein